MEGFPEGYEVWWCLGSQYWAKHKHKKDYSAYYGILLDMVGSKHAQFFREGASLEFAPSVVEKVCEYSFTLRVHRLLRENKCPRHY